MSAEPHLRIPGIHRTKREVGAALHLPMGEFFSPALSAHAEVDVRFKTEALYASARGFEPIPRLPDHSIEERRTQSKNQAIPFSDRPIYSDVTHRTEPERNRRSRPRQDTGLFWLQGLVQPCSILPRQDTGF